MVTFASVGSLIIKIVKLIVNLTAIIIYRTGYGGSFLGIGGTWNLNEEKSPDAEIVASGILVGYFIYTSVQVIAYFFREDKEHRELSDTIMNVVGVLLWVGVGATALHYWVGYMPDYDMLVVTSERTMGIILGCLCVLSAILYLVDSILTFIHYAQHDNEAY